MKRTICYIDDKIPVSQFPEYFNERSLIDKAVLNFLLKCKDTDWSEDINVKDVIDVLIKKEKDVNIKAFTAPIFFINYRNNVDYINPDIILYDWDYNYPPGSNLSQKFLLDILETTYAVIVVYTGADNYDEIDSIIKNEPFISYKDRLEILEKSEIDSTNKVISVSNKKFKSNFSFEYGKTLLHNSNRILNEILAEISSLSVEQFVASFGVKNNNKYRLASEEFASIVFDKYKQRLIYNIDSVELTINKTQDIDENIVKNNWAYRLYYKDKNEFVKQGDIVKDEDNNLFVVFSSDCHIDKFWNKNYGYVSLIPLFKIEKEGKCKKLLDNLKKTDSFSITSLVNSRSIDDITILPAIPYNEENSNYVLFPKGIFTVFVEVPDITGIEKKEIKRNYPLKYEYWNRYEKVVSISETFKYPLIMFIQNHITGYGCPDFPHLLQKHLNEDFKNSLI